MQGFTALTWRFRLWRFRGGSVEAQLPTDSPKDSWPKRWERVRGVKALKGPDLVRRRGEDVQGGGGFCHTVLGGWLGGYSML